MMIWIILQYEDYWTSGQRLDGTLTDTACYTQFYTRIIARVIHVIYSVICKWGQQHNPANDPGPIEWRSCLNFELVISALCLFFLSSPSPVFIILRIQLKLFVRIIPRLELLGFYKLRKRIIGPNNGLVKFNRANGNGFDLKWGVEWCRVLLSSYCVFIG